MDDDWGQNNWLGDFVRATQEQVIDLDFPAINGIGSLATDLAGFPTPLILADAGVLEIDPGEFQRDRHAADGLPPFVFPFEALPAVTRRLLGITDAPPQTVVMATERPEPLGLLSHTRSAWTQAIPIRSPLTNIRGTLGPRLGQLRDRPPMFLTAGHVTGASGSQVERIRLRKFRPTNYEPLGEVIVHSDPIYEPGYDAAVISRTGRTPTPVPTLPVADRDQYSPHPQPATLLGAMSGRGDGIIEGSLALHTDGIRLWKNSWIFVPGHLGMEGDSGGAVITPEGKALGILVGGSRILGHRAFASLYVQDLASIERELLSQLL